MYFISQRYCVVIDLCQVDQYNINSLLTDRVDSAGVEKVLDQDLTIYVTLLNTITICPEGKL